MQMPDNNEETSAIITVKTIEHIYATLTLVMVLFVC
jgi:hypothetical protein